MNKEIVIEMEETTTDLMQTLSSFADEQFNRIPFEGSWTGGQVAEHLLKSNITPLLYGSTEKTSRKPDEKIQKIKESFLNFKVKMKNPDFNTPSNNKHNKEKTIDSLANAYQKAKQAAGTLDLTQTCLDFQAPGLEKMTRLEWLYFMLYHTQRHTHQLKNILHIVQEQAAIQ